MMRTVSFGPMSKDRVLVAPSAEIFLDGDAVGSIEKNTQDMALGLSRRIVVTDYAVWFHAEGLPEEYHHFIVEADPRRFAAEAHRIQRDAAKNLQSRIVYVGPYETAAKALAAAKAWVRDTLKAM